MRLDPFAAAPKAIKGWYDYSLAQEHDGIEPGLAHLVKIRASQINGCANCVNMHTREARAHGETEQRIYLLDVWREAPVYTDRERAALAWTEALTLIATTRAPDTIYADIADHFSDEERVKLTLLINVINGWNRIAVGFGIFAAEPQREAA